MRRPEKRLREKGRIDNWLALAREVEKIRRRRVDGACDGATSQLGVLGPKFSFGSSVSGKLDPRRHPGEEPSDCLEVCDVLPIRTGRLLDRHTRPQCAVGEVIQNGVGNLAQEGDPPGAIGLQHGSGLRRTAHRLNRRDHAGGARRLEKVPAVHNWPPASCLCKTTLLRAGSWKLETESLLNWPIRRFGSGSLQIAF